MSVLLAGGVRIVSANYANCEEAIRHVRFAVFVEEQNVPADLEMDDRDPLCFHVLALDNDGTPLGTGRIDVADQGRIGRMAVLPKQRGRGIGAALLEALHDHARQHGCAAVWCHAQISAQGFYERCNYVSEGDLFSEAGIDHTTMRRRL